VERNIQRINGIKMDLAKLSEAEIEAGLEYAHARVEEGVQDIEKLGIESARRFNADEVAFDGIVRYMDDYRPDPNQGVLFEPPEPA
jgi:hypothetical protein